MVRWSLRVRQVVNEDIHNITKAKTVWPGTLSSSLGTDRFLAVALIKTRKASYANVAISPSENNKYDNEETSE
jgi:hypothetical protein